MQHIFLVTGMTCGHCEKAVMQAIHRIDPQAQVRIDRSANQVTVDSAQLPADIASAIAEEGYTVTV